MKTTEKEEARRLRKEGLSMKEIASKVHVSKGSVSLWVRDIVLTDAQCEALGRKMSTDNGAEFNRVKFSEIRKQYQEAGRKMLGEKGKTFLSGCMLYWAEGTKSRNQLDFTNSDPDMMKYFIGFLRSEFNVSDDRLAISINCFTDIRSVEEIESFWLKTLSLPKSSLRKTITNYHSSYSSKKRTNKLPYGVCKLRVSSFEILNKIYGAIQEAASFKSEVWI